MLINQIPDHYNRQTFGLLKATMLASLVWFGNYFNHCHFSRKKEKHVTVPASQNLFRLWVIMTAFSISVGAINQWKN